MSARIRHLALYTENQNGMTSFYKTVFGMKRITESFSDANHGHISDGVIGPVPLLKEFIGLESLEMAQRAYDRLRDIWPDNGMPTERGLKNVASMAEVPAGVPMEKIVDCTLVKEVSSSLRSK